MARGKFIVLEGGEGSGKSSAVSWLKSELSEDDFVFTREPGGTPNAEEIRNTIISHREDELDTLTHLLLFEAARREHVLKKITPALKSGKHVICDRFSASTYAYQIIAGEHEELREFFLSTDALVRNNIDPDIIIFLDIDPRIGMERKNSSGERLNVFDEKDIEFHDKVRRGLQEYTKDRPSVTIDASKTQQEVRDAVKRAILETIM